MGKQITRTGLTANAISKQVRMLHCAQERVHESLQRVEKLVQLKTAVSEVDKANREGDYLTASKKINEIFLRNKSLKKEKLDFEQVDKLSFDTLKQLQEEIKEKVKDKCQEAYEKKDLQSVLPYAEMFAYLDCRAQGLQLRCKTLKSLFRKELEEEQPPLVLISNYSSKYGEPDHVHMVDGVVHLLTQKFSKEAKKLESVYGVGAVLQLAHSIHNLSVEVLGPIVNQYRMKAIQPIVKLLPGHSRSSSDDDSSMPDTKQVDDKLEELKFMCCDLKTLDFVLRKNAEQALISIDESENPAEFEEGCKKKLKIGTFLDNAVYDLVSDYVALEQYLMRQNVKLAIKRDELPPDQIFSTMVLDTFKLLRMAAERSFDTFDVEAACATVNYIHEILEDDYKKHLSHQLNEITGQGSKFGSLFEQKEPEDPSKIYILLNNICRSSTFAQKLKEFLEEHTEENFDGLDPKDRRKMLNIIEILNEDIRSFSRLARRGVEHHFRNLQHLVDDNVSFKVMKYDLLKSELENSRIGYGWVDQFISAVSAKLEELKSLFTDQNFERFIDILMNHLIFMVENFLWRKQFTSFGGLHLEHEIRTLLKFFNKFTLTGVREKFSNLRDMAQILQIASIDELSVLLGHSKLDLSLVKRTLGLRKDLKKEEIEKMWSQWDCS